MLGFWFRLFTCVLGPWMIKDRKTNNDLIKYTNLYMRRCLREICLILGLNSSIIEIFCLWTSCFEFVLPRDNLIQDGLYILCFWTVWFLISMFVVVGFEAYSLVENYSLSLNGLDAFKVWNWNEWQIVNYKWGKAFHY